MKALYIIPLVLACGEEEKDVVATFTQVNDELLMKSCAFSSCHGSGQGGFLLEAEGNYDRIVTAQSTVTGEDLIVPGDADSSYLFRKVIGADDIAGDIMAPNGAGISTEQETLLRSWIENGATEN